MGNEYTKFLKDNRLEDGLLKVFLEDKLFQAACSHIDIVLEEYDKKIEALYELRKRIFCRLDEEQ